MVEDRVPFFPHFDVHDLLDFHNWIISQMYKYVYSLFKKKNVAQWLSDKRNNTLPHFMSLTHVTEKISTLILMAVTVLLYVIFGTCTNTWLILISIWYARVKIVCNTFFLFVSLSRAHAKLHVVRKWPTNIFF